MVNCAVVFEKIVDNKRDEDNNRSGAGDFGEKTKEVILNPREQSGDEGGEFLLDFILFDIVGKQLVIGVTQAVADGSIIIGE